MRPWWEFNIPMQHAACKKRKPIGHNSKAKRTQTQISDHKKTTVTLLCKAKSVDFSVLKSLNSGRWGDMESVLTCTGAWTQESAVIVTRSTSMRAGAPVALFVLRAESGATNMERTFGGGSEGAAKCAAGAMVQIPGVSGRPLWILLATRPQREYMLSLLLLTACAIGL